MDPEAQEDLGVGGGCAGDLAAGADVGVAPAQIELVDDGGDRTHLVIGGHLGVEVDPAPRLWISPRCARLTRTSRSGCTGQLGPADPARLSAPPVHNGDWVADPVPGSRPLAAHGPARFQPARKSQVWAGGNATSVAPADEYGST